MSKFPRNGSDRGHRPYLEAGGPWRLGWVQFPGRVELAGEQVMLVIPGPHELLSDVASRPGYVVNRLNIAGAARDQPAPVSIQVGRGSRYGLRAAPARQPHQAVVMKVGADIFWYGDGKASLVGAPSCPPSPEVVIIQTGEPLPK